MYYYKNLQHSGVKGQKHGVRLYQYKDGSLTPLGRIHYGVGKMREKKAEKKVAIAKKKRDEAFRKSSNRARFLYNDNAGIEAMSDAELTAATERLKKEFLYRDQLSKKAEYIDTLNAKRRESIATQGKNALLKQLGKGSVKILGGVGKLLVKSAAASLGLDYDDDDDQNNGAANNNNNRNNNNNNNRNNNNNNNNNNNSNNSNRNSNNNSGNNNNNNNNNSNNNSNRNSNNNSRRNRNRTEANTPSGAATTQNGPARNDNTSAIFDPWEYYLRR